MIKIGEKYSNWTVLRETKKINRKQWFLCRCNCLREKEVRIDHLRSGSSNFCMMCRHEKTIIKKGDVFGKWTVLQQIETPEKRKHYEVQCECGFIRILKGIRLRFGDSLKCKKCASTTHGLTHSRTYATWESMIQRCTNKKHKNYKHYGARGIQICNSWLLFENFLKDMGKRPNKLELDRIDNNGNYEKSNCRWATRSKNLKNRNR